jgi:hypothetical protein
MQGLSYTNGLPSTISSRSCVVKLTFNDHQSLPNFLMDTQCHDDAATATTAAPRPPCAASDELSINNNNWIREDCVEFYQEHLAATVHCRKRVCLMRLSLTHAYRIKKQIVEAQFLEFGVFEGKDITNMAAHLRLLDSSRGALLKEHHAVLHGFDSFIGLPEEWANGQLLPDGSNMFKTGMFCTDGEAPVVSQVEIEIGNKKGSIALSSDVPNIVFHKGWFADTVPVFFDENPLPIAFVHADSDLYSSTKTFLDEMCQRRLLVTGSIILFDEFWNYEGWQDGEYKAWCEAVRDYNISFQYYAIHAPKLHKTSRCFYGYQSVAIYIEDLAC